MYDNLPVLSQHGLPPSAGVGVLTVRLPRDLDLGAHGSEEGRNGPCLSAAVDSSAGQEPSPAPRPPPGTLAAEAAAEATLPAPFPLGSCLPHGVIRAAVGFPRPRARRSQGERCRRAAGWAASRVSSLLPHQLQLQMGLRPPRSPSAPAPSEHALVPKVRAKVVTEACMGTLLPH